MTPLDQTVSDNLPRREPGRVGWLLLAPMLLWMLLFVIAPNVILLVYSFCENDQNEHIKWTFTLENYGRIFDSSYFGIFMRSVGYAALTTALCVLMGYPVAWFIGRAPDVWRNRLLTVVMIPFWTSFLIRTFAWILILRQQGFMNAFLQSSGVIPHLIELPLDILYSPTAVVIGLVYSYLPFMILPIYGSVEKLDNSLVEAAFDLGAGPARAFSRVIIPLTQPGIVAGVLLVFIPAIGMFAISDLLGGKKTPMIGNVIQQQFGAANNWPFGAALGMALMAMFVVGFWFVTRKQPA